MFSYNISAEANEKDFKKACEKIENEFANIEKENILEDVDGSLIQIYTTPNGKIKVFNDYEVDAVYVDSDEEIKCFN